MVAGAKIGGGIRSTMSSWRTATVGWKRVGVGIGVKVAAPNWGGAVAGNRVLAGKRSAPWVAEAGRDVDATGAAEGSAVATAVQVTSAVACGTGVAMSRASSVASRVGKGVKVGRSALAVASALRVPTERTTSSGTAVDVAGSSDSPGAASVAVAARGKILVGLALGVAAGTEVSVAEGAALSVAAGSAASVDGIVSVALGTGVSLGVG